MFLDRGAKGGQSSTCLSLSVTRTHTHTQREAGEDYVVLDDVHVQECVYLGRNVGFVFGLWVTKTPL